MSKYKKFNIRPAGDSDEYDSDSDGFSFPEEDFNPKRRTNYAKDNNYEDDQPNLEDYSCLDKKAQIEAKHKTEFEALKACMSGNQEVIDNYVKAGNDVNEFLHTGWTLMLYAASSIQSETVKQLLTLGADPNIHKECYTPLMALSNSIKNNIETKALECLNILLEAKADPNATSKNRENALMFAMKLRSLEFIEKLIKLTDNLDMTDSDGNTALHYAVFSKRVDVVRLIVQNNVDTTIRNRHGVTAYDSAVIKELEDIADILSTNIQYDVPTCEILNVSKWQDMFPDLTNVDENKVLENIATILYGMGLEHYKHLFKGMSLNKFLNLTDEDLKELGMDLSIHRQRFLENLYKFHSHTWNQRSLVFPKTKAAYKIFDGILSLGNLVKKFCVIGSSFNYIRRNIKNEKTDSLVIPPEQKNEYEIEIEKTENIMINLKQELELFKNIAKQIKIKNRDSYPATNISKKKQVKWPIIISFAAILGLCLSKTQYVQRLLPFDQ